ncbi:hypothetical protein FLJC2902T_07420 [Flavobacterium limnosediminis JC2902]|uniref:Uncharacterized protein n=1 Tax=Flavobacterium limnosediminis JC2902 TaxID=1341181 RepID=V6SY57_9FLAO|nr:hypothetical protein [Flavobacterium limnosediminis]ESU29345.1 hypothetical protein FLJC2902T_07420 [Flavobacterium limnosediminis JC2902]
MKNFAIKLVWFTTIFVLVFTGLCQTNVPLPFISSLFILGSALFLYTVYKVLTDKYETTKTFKDWYGDFPEKH